MQQILEIMQLKFEEDYLRDLYSMGKTKDKHHRFQPQVVRGYQKALNLLKMANRIEDLFVFSSLNFESLSGNKSGRYSIRANGQYRIEFLIENEGDQMQVSICNILELSNHYQ